MGRSTFGQCTQPCSETYYYRDPRYLSWRMYYPRGCVSQKKEKKKGKKEQAGRTEKKETDKFWASLDKSRLSDRIDRSLKHEGCNLFIF